MTVFDAMAAECVQVLENNLAFARLLPRTRRVRRRGFRSNVKRGDTVRYDGKIYDVARRSNWSLWLYEHVEPMAPGAVIKVRLPRRYQ